MSGLPRKSTDAHAGGGHYGRSRCTRIAGILDSENPTFPAWQYAGFWKTCICLLWGDYVAVEHPISDRHNGYHMMDGIFDKICKLLLTLHRLRPKISTGRQTFLKCFFIFGLLLHENCTISNQK